MTVRLPRSLTGAPALAAVIGVVSLLSAAAIVTGALALVQARHLASEQAAGRRVGLSVTCAATSAISEAGRQVIASSVTPAETQTVRQRRFEHNLEKLGYPPASERRAAANLAAQAYVQRIAQTVERQSGISGIVRKDGTLDCRRLRMKAAAIKR